MIVAASTWWEIVLAASAGVAAVALLSQTWLRSLTRVKFQPVEVRIDQSPAPQAVAAPHPPEIVFVDYVDRELLDEIASQKGMATGSLTVEDSLAQSATAEEARELSAGLSLPAGSLRVGGKASSREAVERSRQLRRSMQYSYSTRGLIDDVVMTLERDGLLRRELLDVPAANETDAELLQGLIGVWTDWGISQLPKPLPEEDNVKRLDEAITLLMDHATERTLATKVAELKTLAESTKSSPTFALADTEWDVTEEHGELVMLSGWLVERDPPLDPWIKVIADGLVRVPLDRAKLAGLGSRRLRSGASVSAKVLGLIDSFDDEDECLVLVPLAVFGTHR